MTEHVFPIRCNSTSCRNVSLHDSLLTNMTLSFINHIIYLSLLSSYLVVENQYDPTLLLNLTILTGRFGLIRHDIQSTRGKPIYFTAELFEFGTK